MGGVIISGVAPNLGTSRQVLRLLENIESLPIELIVGHGDKQFSRSIWILRRNVHPFTPVVHVRKYVVEQNIFLKLMKGTGFVLFYPRRDVNLPIERPIDL